MKRSPLARSEKPLERKSSLSRGKGLQSKGRPGEARTAVQSPKRAVSSASHPQKLKAKAEGKCRYCGIPDSVIAVHPAHVIDRSIGGCDDPACIAPLCFICHRAYDEGDLDLLPSLTLEEQAHAVSHVGIARAAKRITNDRDPLL